MPQSNQWQVVGETPAPNAPSNSWNVVSETPTSNQTPPQNGSSQTTQPSLAMAFVNPQAGVGVPPMPQGAVDAISSATKKVGQFLSKPLVNAENDPMFQLPLIVGSYAKNHLEQTGHPTAAKVAGAYTGVQQAETDAFSGMSSPENLAIMGATAGLGSIPGMAGKLLPRLVSAGFSAQMLYGAYKNIAPFKQAVDSGDYETASRLLTTIGINAGMAGMAGTHAAMGEGAPQANTPVRSEELPVEVAPNPDLKKGQGTSAAFLTEAPPKTNLPQEVQNHTTEIARLQAIIDNPSALPEEKAYASQALAASQDQRATLQTPVAEGVGGPTQGGLSTPVDTEPRATQLAGGMPQPSDVLRSNIGSHPWDETPDSAGEPPQEQPPIQERLRVHEEVLNNVADPERINSPEDVAKVTQQTAQFLGGKADARITQPLTLPLRQQLAREMGLSEQDFLNTPIGQAVSPEFIEAGRTILDNSRNRLMDAMQSAKDDPSKTDSAFDALAKHQMIKQVFEQRLAKEAGRSLQAVNDAARGGDARGRTTMDDIADSLSQMSDSAKKEAIRRFNLLDKNNPAAIEKFARDIKPSSTWDQLHEAWISALVSGGATLAKLGSDTAMEAMSGLTKMVAGAADYTRSKVTGTPRERLSSEALSVIDSKLFALPDAAKAFLRGWREEIDPNGNEYGRKTLAIKGAKGKIIRVPLRFLSAVTEMEHVLNYATQIDSQAIRQALSESSGAEVYDPFKVLSRMKELRANPTDEMKADAHRYARTQTFQGDFSGPGAYNAAVRWVQSGRESVPGGRWAAPFVTTPANLLKESSRYSPFGFVGTTKGALTDGLSGGELSDNLGKNIVGTALWATALHYALAGKLTGSGPSDYKKLAALKSTGWQPYSYRTSKGTYISYARLAPVSVALGLAANLVESLREPNKKTNIGEKFMTGLVKTGSLAKDINFLSGMSDVVNDIEGAFEGTESKKTALGGIAASELVPGVVRDTAHIVDPTVRKPTTVGEQFETQIPGLSKNVPAKTDISGKPIQRDVRNLGGFNPYTVSQATTDETTKEQARLAQLPPKPTKLELAGIAPATPREQTQLNSQEALMLHDRLSVLQKQGVLNGMSDDNKQRLIARVKSVIAKSRNERLLELRKSSQPQPSQATNAWQVVSEQPAQ